MHGYVGNKSATLPLQLLGIEVDAVNSVQLSTHTGYRGGIWGQRLGGEDIDTLVRGLRGAGLLGAYSHVLSGYLGNVAALRAVLAAVRAVREANPRAVYVCDPVLGDNGRLYCPAELVPVYRSEALPLATLLCPNQFEVRSGCIREAGGLLSQVLAQERRRGEVGGLLRRVRCLRRVRPAR